MVHLGQFFEVCSQDPTKIKNESCRARDSEHSHFLVHLGQLFEVCSQNSTKIENRSCRARDSEHIDFFDSPWSVCSQNPTIDFKSVPRGSEPWHLINFNILKFVHKILLTFKMEVIELVILNSLIF